MSRSVARLVAGALRRRPHLRRRRRDRRPRGATRSNEYLQHQTALAAAAPASAGAARDVPRAAPRTRSRTRPGSTTPAFGWTNVPVDLMQDYVSAQTYALRSPGNGRFGFAWAPKNLAAMPAADFTAQTDALLVAARGRDRRLRGRARGGVRGRLVQPRASPAPRSRRAGARSRRGSRPRLAFTTPAPTLAAGAASPALTLELRTSTGVPYTAGLPVAVELSSSSPTAAFATSPAGPWTATLAVPIASGSSTTSFYFRDTPPGSADDRRARAAGKDGATQTATVTGPADTTPPETTIGTAPAGARRLLGGVDLVLVERGRLALRVLARRRARSLPARRRRRTPGSPDGRARVRRPGDRRGGQRRRRRPRARSWTSDTLAPETTITSGPSGPTRIHAASFPFADRGGRPLRVLAERRRVDGVHVAWADRSPPGRTRFRRARDGRGGERRRAPRRRRTWTVDLTAAGHDDHRRAAAPSRRSTLGDVRVLSAERERALRLLARRRRLRAVPVAAAPQRARAGNALVRVRAVDAAGNVDPTPATRRGAFGRGGV